MAELVGWLDSVKSIMGAPDVRLVVAGRDPPGAAGSKDLFDRLRDLAPSERQNAGPAIGRAIKNLMTALSHRIGRDGLDEDLLHEIAAILDEAAQRVERVK